MADEGRCCGGRCCESTPVDLNRRDFMEKLAVGTAALAVIGDYSLAADAAGAEKNSLAPAARRRSCGLSADDTAGLPRRES